MTEALKFTAIMATYNRGRHILPSVHSVLRQSLSDFELLIVGDGCTDETEAVVLGLESDKVRWINLPTHLGSQSFANNAGIEQARSRYIAYIGHDDIWGPNHLQLLLERCFSDDQISIAVSGLLIHPAPGDPVVRVLGLFDDDTTPLTQFFPPTSLAHVRSLTEIIGPWGNPRELRAPVDADLLLRAGRAGLRFRSTRTITAHKFTAATRYLSYTAPSSREQEAILERLRSEHDFDRYLADRIEAAKAGGGYMTSHYPDYGKLAPGELHRWSVEAKGSDVSCLRLTDMPVVIRPKDGLRANDWSHKPRNGFIWARRNPRPKLLIPVTHDGPTAVAMVLGHPTREALAGLSLAGGDASAPELGEPYFEGGLWRCVAAFDVALRSDGPTVIELLLAEEQLARSKDDGLGVGDIVLVSKSARPAAVDLARIPDELKQAVEAAHGRRPTPTGGSEETPSTGQQQSRAPSSLRVLVLGRHSNDWMTALAPESAVWSSMPAISDIAQFDTVEQLALLRTDPEREFVLPLLEGDVFNCPPRCWALVPETSAMMTFADKRRYATYVAEQDLAAFVPRDIDIRSPQFPCVLKRTDLSAGVGVVVVGSRNELGERLIDPLWRGRPYVLQELIEAETEFVTHCVAVDGRVVWQHSYQYQVESGVTIRTPDNTVGTGPYECPASDLAILERFLLPLRYSGPANFAFKRRADGRAAVFEINPRLGGSLMRPENASDLRSILTCIIEHARWRP